LERFMPVTNTTLDTVADYITDTRNVLQDVISPFRYDDPSLLTAFNVSLLETRRLRADLFMNPTYNGVVPTFQEIDTTKVAIEQPFRLALVFGACAHALARDQEDYQDARATAFMAIFQGMLLGLAIPALTGGSPAAGGK
jgi:hypothetical protein